MIACMGISIVFLLTDIIVTALHITKNAGINPYWRVSTPLLHNDRLTKCDFKFALVFKCASDTIFLDDFKSVLDGIVAASLSNNGGRAYSIARRKTGGPMSPEFIECDPIATEIHSPSAPPRSRMINPFASRDPRMSQSRIHVQSETIVSSSPVTHKKSVDSFGSNRDILSRPSATLSPDRDEYNRSISQPRSYSGSNPGG